MNNYNEQSDAYSNTLYAENCECMIGEAQNSNIQLKDYINLKKCWQEILQYYPDLILDEFIFMTDYIWCNIK